MPETQDGLILTTQVNNIGFTEFTSGLVTSTFETLTSSAITQLEAFSELVASTAKTLSEYTKDTYGADPQDTDDAGAIRVRNNWIQENLVDPELLKPNDGDLGQATSYDVVPADVPKLVQLFNGIKMLDTDGKTEKDIGESVDSNNALTSTTLHDFVGQKLATTAKSQQDLLVTILKLGMQKLVVTDGHIRTKLTFKVNATEERSKASASVSSKSRSFGVGATFRHRMFGASAAYGSSSYNVNVVNENSYGIMNLNVEIIGEVEIHFRTDSFPPTDPKALGAAA